MNKVVFQKDNFLCSIWGGEEINGVGREAMEKAGIVFPDDDSFCLVVEDLAIDCVVCFQTFMPNKSGFVPIKEPDILSVAKYLCDRLVIFSKK